MPIKQAGYISATSAIHAKTHLLSAAGPYMWAHRRRRFLANSRLYAVPSSAIAGSSVFDFIPEPSAAPGHFRWPDYVPVTGGIC